MKKLLLLFALFAVALSATASPTERWLDPECFAENRAPMRTSFIVFPTASEAVPENDYTRSPFYRTLNGEWAFLRAERPGAEPEGFFRTGYDDSSWGVMPVPGIWELNGYGDPVYTNKPRITRVSTAAPSGFPPIGKAATHSSTSARRPRT